MTNKKLIQIYNRYEEILHSKLSDYEMNRQLLGLMTDLEASFQPFSSYSSDHYPAGRRFRHRSVSALYRMISQSRFEVISQVLRK